MYGNCVCRNAPSRPHKTLQDRLALYINDTNFNNLGTAAETGSLGVEKQGSVLKNRKGPFCCRIAHPVFCLNCEWRNAWDGSGLAISKATLPERNPGEGAIPTSASPRALVAST